MIHIHQLQINTSFFCIYITEKEHRIIRKSFSDYIVITREKL